MNVDKINKMDAIVNKLESIMNDLDVTIEDISEAIEYYNKVLPVQNEIIKTVTYERMSDEELREKLRNKELPF